MKNEIYCEQMTQLIAIKLKFVCALINFKNPCTKSAHAINFSFMTRQTLFQSLSLTPT